MKRNPKDRTLLDIYRKLYSRYGAQDWWPARTRFEVIVGAILTQNTAWTNVEKAIRRLRKAGLLTPEKIHNVPAAALAKHIKSAGYFNVKARRLKNFVGLLASRYALNLSNMAAQPSDLLRHQLLAVNGIGPETCDSIMLYAFNRPVFVVDAYTKRIFTRHRIIGKDATYHEIQALFMAGMPPDTDLYNEYHALIVALGKDFCRPRPRCAACPLRSFRHDAGAWPELT